MHGGHAQAELKSSPLGWRAQDKMDAGTPLAWLAATGVPPVSTTPASAFHTEATPLPKLSRGAWLAHDVAALNRPQPLHQGRLHNLPHSPAIRRCCAQHRGRAQARGPCVDICVVGVAWGHHAQAGRLHVRVGQRPCGGACDAVWTAGRKVCTHASKGQQAANRGVKDTWPCGYVAAAQGQALPTNGLLKGAVLAGSAGTCARVEDAHHRGHRKLACSMRSSIGKGPRHGFMVPARTWMSWRRHVFRPTCLRGH